MRRIKSLAVLALSSLALILSGCQADHDLQGHWVEKNGDYAVTFSEDGTYTDNLTGVPLEYLETSDGLTYFTLSGDMCYDTPSWDMMGTLHLYIGGKDRELKASTSEKDHSFPSQKSLMSGRVVSERYTLKSALPISSQLFLMEDNSFAYHLLLDGAEAGDWRTEGYAGVRGLAEKTVDGRRIALYYNDGESVDVLRISPYGAYMATFPLSNDGELLVEKDYHNVSLGVESGYVLDGTVFDESNSTFYTFTTDSICTKTAQGGGEVLYNYYVDTEGLITLGPVEGSFGEDYLYYDAKENRVYRLVYQRDSWYDFITAVGADSTQSSPEEGHGARVSSLNPLEHLAVPYAENSKPEWQELGDVDFAYTLDCVRLIDEFREQLKVDEELRRKHEAELLSAQLRFLKREQERAKEQARVKAEMDARVEAEIASGIQPTKPGDELSWLEELIKQLEQSNGYDQDVSTTSPVVDTEKPGQTTPSFSAPPETATPTEPIDPSNKESEPAVSQFAPEFHIDFVCTCVNCYVSTLPVELNADNVLLVDAAVIAPGTLVSVEGYGMVTVRASGGSTSGQTAVCYSNSHNAVTRFSSGTYNVYQVVG